jgi:hypothetical protein
MKISVQPGKRQNGTPRVLFDGQLALGAVISEPAGGVVLSVIGTDIYTPKASQRYTIELSAHDIEAILQALKMSGRSQTTLDLSPPNTSAGTP